MSTPLLSFTDGTCGVEIMTSPFWQLLRQLPQRRFEQRGELALGADLLARRIERGVGDGGAVAEVHEGGVDVIVDRVARGARRHRRAGGEDQLVAELETDPLRGLLADAG